MDEPRLLIGEAAVREIGTWPVPRAEALGTGTAIWASSSRVDIVVPGSRRRGPLEVVDLTPRSTWGTTSQVLGLDAVDA